MIWNDVKRIIWVPIDMLARSFWSDLLFLKFIELETYLLVVSQLGSNIPCFDYKVNFNYITNVAVKFCLASLLSIVL